MCLPASSRLPLEIWILIFSFIIPNARRAWQDLATTRYFGANPALAIEPACVLRNVCALWRDIVDGSHVLAVPLLVVLDERGVAAYNVTRMMSVVNAQAKSPLYAGVLAAAAGSSPPVLAEATTYAIRLVNNQSHRLRGLIVRIHGLSTAPFPALYAPHLTDLYIALDAYVPAGWRYPEHLDNRRQAAEYLNSMDAPALQSLQAYLYRPGPQMEDPPFFQLSYTLLTRLKITVDSLPQLELVLAGCPSLSHLTIRVACGNDVADFATIRMAAVHLDSLHTLKLTADPQYTRVIVRCLRSSASLRELYIRNLSDEDWLDHSWDEIVTTWPHISVLALANFYMTQDNFLEFVRALPLLSSLALEPVTRWMGVEAIPPVGCSFLHALVGGRAILPNLTRLCLHGPSYAAPDGQLPDVIATRMLDLLPSICRLEEFIMSPRCCRRHLGSARYSDERALGALRDAGRNIRFLRRKFYGGLWTWCPECIGESAARSAAISPNPAWGWTADWPDFTDWDA